MAIYGRFGDVVTIHRIPSVEDVERLERRKLDKQDREALLNGSYVVVRQDDGTERLYHQAFLRADGGAAEISAEITRATMLSSDLAAKALALGLDDVQKIVRAAQALTILETLEKLPTGTDLSAYRFSPSYDSLCWEVSLNVGRVNRGETLTDALGQLTTVLVQENDR